MNSARQGLAPVWYSVAQVNLEKGASELAISPAIFAALKQSNPARCEILADLFKRLGLDSQVHEVAKPTAAVLHTTSQVSAELNLKDLGPFFQNII